MTIKTICPSPISINNSEEIYQIIQLLNQSNLFRLNQITVLSTGKSYLKWFAPSIDYPCLLSSYYLYPPYKVSFTPTPTLEVGGEGGESDYILSQVKSKLLETILRAYRL